MNLKLGGFPQKVNMIEGLTGDGALPAAHQRVGGATRVRRSAPRQPREARRREGQQTILFFIRYSLFKHTAATTRATQAYA